ncbi:MAG: NusG domain II-containing protein [Fibrobacteria bacterium]|nr:NusG domain II-containing protein [Fibrobacteria bacterium]
MQILGYVDRENGFVLMKKLPFFKPLDSIIIVLILVVSVWSLTFFTREKGFQAEIFIKAKLVSRLSLNGDEKKFILPSKKGDIHVLYGEGEIRILHAPCKHKICVKHGAISNTREKIICAPSGLLIQITGTGSLNKDSLDAITF